MSDLISRQNAIDKVNAQTVSTNPYHFKSSEKFIEFMDDEDISSFGKWQWANGYNTALISIMILLEKLPPARPERKKGCKIVKGTGTYGYCACDQCGKPVHPEDRFCSKCGADFREDADVET